MSNSFDTTLDHLMTLLQCPICKRQMTPATTVGECGHHFCEACISLVLGKECKCPSCGLPAIVRNLIKNSSYDVLVACVAKLKDLRFQEVAAAAAASNALDKDLPAPHAPSLSLGSNEPPTDRTIWSFDCGPTFTDHRDGEPPSSLLPSLSVVLDEQRRESLAKNQKSQQLADATTNGEQQQQVQEENAAVEKESEQVLGSQEEEQELDLSFRLLSSSTFSAVNIGLIVASRTKETGATSLIGGPPTIQDTRSHWKPRVSPEQDDMTKKLVLSTAVPAATSILVPAPLRRGKSSTASAKARRLLIQQSQDEPSTFSFDFDSTTEAAGESDRRTDPFSLNPTNALKLATTGPGLDENTPAAAPSAVAKNSRQHKGPATIRSTIVSQEVNIEADLRSRAVDLNEGNFSTNPDLYFKNSRIPSQKRKATKTGPQIVHQSDGEQDIGDESEDTTKPFQPVVKVAKPSRASSPQTSSKVQVSRQNANGPKATTGAGPILINPSQRKSSAPVTAVTAQSGPASNQSLRSVTCMFTGLLPEHKAAFDTDSLKLFSTGLLMDFCQDDDFNPGTTHMVTSSHPVPKDRLVTWMSDGSDCDDSELILCTRQTKILSAMLTNTAVVRYEWFLDSIKSRTWIASDQYLFDGDTKFGPAPGAVKRRARRAAAHRKLFDGCEVFFYGEFELGMKSNLMKLVQLGGGKILSRRPTGKHSDGSTPQLGTTPYSDARGLTRLFVDEDIKPWEIVLNLSVPLIICDPKSMASKSSRAPSPVASQSTFKPGTSQKYAWLKNMQAVSAPWLLNCISCSVFGANDDLAVGNVRDKEVKRQEELRVLDEAWQRWHGGSKS